MDSESRKQPLQGAKPKSRWTKGPHRDAVRRSEPYKRSEKPESSRGGDAPDVKAMTQQSAATSSEEYTYYSTSASPSPRVRSPPRGLSSAGSAGKAVSQDGKSKQEINQDKKGSQKDLKGKQASNLDEKLKQEKENGKQDIAAAETPSKAEADSPPLSGVTAAAAGPSMVLETAGSGSTQSLPVIRSEATRWLGLWVANAATNEERWTVARALGSVNQVAWS